MELQLSKPEFLTLKSPDGNTGIKIDIFEARRMLETAEKKPTEKDRVTEVLSYLAEKLSLNKDDLAENMAYEFQDAINRCVIASLESRKKRLAQIVSSPGSTKESPTTTEAGQ